MNCTACQAQLNDLVDGALSPADARAIADHAAACPACRVTLYSLRALRAATAALPRERTPARDLWSGIAVQLTDRATTPASAAVPATAPTARGPLIRWFVPLGLAAAIVVLSTVAEQNAARSLHRSGWSVASLAGTPRIDAAPLQGNGQFHRGQWLETDATARAEVNVGTIGRVEVESNSRLRLVATAATDHRVELARGTMSALIWAPPRLFFVNTPSATAVDLGCAYTLKVNDAGDGELHVTAGYVALEDGGRESIIPYRHLCLTRRGAGPGTPFAEDAPAALRATLQRFDFDALSAAATTAVVTELLTLARPEDAVTLWHLLTRAPVAQRPAVFDALAARRPPPASVTRAGILAGDADMRRTWGIELGLGTFAQPVR